MSPGVPIRTPVRSLAIRRAFLVMAVALILGPATATGTIRANETVTSAGPVTSYTISPDLNCAASYVGDVRGEFFGDTACVTAIATPDGLYAPASVPAGSSLTGPALELTPISQTLDGAGTPTSPFAIRTTVQAGVIRLVQVDSYSLGSSRIRTSMTLSNTGGTPVSFDVFRAGDCFARDSDFGFGQMGAESAACVSSVEARTVRFLATPASAGSQPTARTYQGFFSDLWQRIGSFAPGGSRLDFDGSCRCAEEIDNAAGLQWRIDLGPGQTTELRSAIDLGTVAADGGLGAPLAPVTGATTGRPYVALGDSFSSGEGAGDQRRDSGYEYIPPSDSRGNRCHRSRNAYPMLIAPGLGLDPATELDFRACSGAVIADLRRPNARNGNEPAQFDGLGENTELVTLTIGGNDAGFASILTECAKPRAFGSHAGCEQTKAKDVDAAYETLAGLSGDQSLLQVYTEIVERIGPGASLWVLGYPDFVPFESAPGGCKTASRFSAAESSWLSGSIRSFNSLIAQRAAWAGAHFVDVDRLFQPNHRVCSSDEWVNGIRGLGDLEANSESFHPNALGHQAYATAFRRRFSLGESNESLSGPQAGTFSREHAITPAGISPPVSTVVRKGVDASIPLDVVAGQSLIASLRYADAAPVLALSRPDGTPVAIAALPGPPAGLDRTPGASTFRIGGTTVVQLRGLPTGRYSLAVRLPDEAPSTAGVLSARLSTLTETNLAPIAVASVRLDSRRRLRASGSGSSDAEGGRLTFRWNFGDGTTASREVTRHRYRSARRYRAALSVTDDVGGRSVRRFIVETRSQAIGRLRVKVLPRSSTARVTLRCAPSTVEACESRLRVRIDRATGRDTSRTIAISARRGRSTVVELSLGGRRGARFAGTVSATGTIGDAAVRPSPQRAVARATAR